MPQRGPNYNYDYVGSGSRLRFIIGIDNQYRLTAKNWKAVDLTPEMLNNWINFIRPRVGYSEDPYGAFIVGPMRNGSGYGIRCANGGSRELAKSERTTRFPPPGRSSIGATEIKATEMWLPVLWERISSREFLQDWQFVSRLESRSHS